jgi:hypothetical protein
MSTNITPLQDHAARLRIVRAARQLDMLFREIRPELFGALEALPADERQPVAKLVGEIEHGLTSFGVIATTLLSSEPAESTAAFSTMEA